MQVQIGAPITIEIWERIAAVPVATASEIGKCLAAMVPEAVEHSAAPTDPVEARRVPVARVAPRASAVLEAVAASVAAAAVDAGKHWIVKARAS
jgi:hypothetical protein